MSTREYKSLPNSYKTYAKIVKSLLPVIGNKNKGSKNTLPEATYSVSSLVIDQSNLRNYRRICGFSEDGFIPATYFSVLSQSLQMNMMVNEPFPFAMLGLVHIENSVTQYRPIRQDEVFAMHVSFANLADHDKGKQFQFITKVYDGDELVWEGSSTYLSRQKMDKSSKRKKTKSESLKKAADMRIVFEVPEDLGRRYAKVSGDYNLIHLHSVTAKAFGFRKAIAHGMWSKAKCLSLLELPDSFKADVSFKLPILLPSEVELISEDMSKLDDEHNINFDLLSVKRGRPHLAGKVFKI